MDKKVELMNGLQLQNLCYGSAIVQRYKYGNSDVVHRTKYWMKNVLKNHKQLKLDLALPKMIQGAMRYGCTMFDTSRAYAGSEHVIGQALKNYDRNSYTIITKLCNADQYKHNVAGALKKSLDELQLEYVDVYLMHWPVDECYLESWKEMEKLYHAGLCKAIGVCNCNIHHLQKIMDNSEVKPMINQIECHPLFTQNDLRKFCKENSIQVMAYTSTARMDERLYKTCLVPIAKKYNKSVAQIIIRWHQQLGNIPIVNTSEMGHLIQNIQIGDFYLTQEEMDNISHININSRLRYDPDNCDFTQL